MEKNTKRRRSSYTTKLSRANKGHGQNDVR